MAFLPGIDWTRPLGAWALLLSLAFLLLARLLGRPRSVPTGTFELWREVLLQSSSRGPSQRLRLPLWAWCALVSMLCGALALAGPRRARVEPPRTFRVVVDLRPAMGLPAPGNARSGESAGTRLDVGLAAARDWLEVVAGPDDRVRWIAPGRKELVLDADETPPPTWLALPRAPLPAPRWALHDLELTLWVTDVLEGPGPERAGLFASGAEPAPGPVAWRGDLRLDWDGTELVQRTDESTRPSVRIDPELPDPLVSLARAWARTRGIREVSASVTRLVELRVEAAPGELDPVRVRAGRDGWVAEGLARGISAGRLVPGVEPWLRVDPAGHGGRALIAHGEGVVLVGWEGMGLPGGDPSRFAVSFGELLDRTLLDPSGVVSLAERLRQGPLRNEPPAEPGAAGDGESGPRGGDDFLAAWAAALAAGFALAALSGGLFGRD